jgi:hypothetical protein
MFEELVIWAMDQDAQWWPFARWRPAPDEEMTSDLCAKMTLAYGGIAMIFVAAIMSFEKQVVAPSLPIFLVVFLASVFAIFRSLAVVWNRRARRLRALHRAG